MKVNWFCPLPPMRTGIAVWTRQVLPYLAAAHEVRLFTTQATVASEVKDIAPVLRFDTSSPPWADLNGADVNIYNIGNNAEFHLDIQKISKLHPGVVILHDIRLHDFVWMSSVKGKTDFKEYLEAMERWYGTDGARAAEQFIAGGYVHRNLADEMAQHYPLTREVVDGALGVITHGGPALESMGEVPDCPVTMLKFPHTGIADDAYKAIAEARRKHEPPYRILVFGYIGLNRRVVPLLEALACVADRERFQIEICGELWDKSAVMSAVQRLHLQDVVVLRGRLLDEAVHQTLADADIAVNLRHPTMGEASLTQMEFWEFGLPTLVTRAGWYASLPKEAVCFVDPLREVDEIRDHFQAFLADPHHFYGIGEAGRRALAHHHPREYANQVVDFAKQVTAVGHRVAGTKLATSAGTELRRWLEPSMSKHMLAKVSAEIQDLFYGPSNH